MNLPTAQSDTWLEPVEGEEPDIVIGTREHIFHLLAEAAEIEHTLMCSYLYAAFSLKPQSDPGFTQSQAEAVKDWNDAIMSVAIEEMGHLLIVANLTVAIGGRPHFSRPNFPVSDGYFPSGVQLSLCPFSLETLDHFIFLERPTGLTIEDGAGFAGSDCERKQAHLGLMPTTQDYTTVSHLYEAIRANLTAFAERHGEERLFLASALSQLGSGVVQFSGIDAVTDLASAHRAIDLIVEQGEGSRADRSDSHFARFNAIRDRFNTMIADDSNFAPAYEAAKNPVFRRASDMSGRTFIGNAPAAAVLDFGNAVYGLLLRLLVQVYAEGLAERKSTLMNTAILMMHVLGACGRLLPRLPAGDGEQSAGMTFTMLRAVDPFVGGGPEKVLISERIAEISTVASRLARKHPELKKAAELLHAAAQA